MKNMKPPDSSIQDIVKQFNIDNRVPFSFEKMNENKTILSEYFDQIRRWIELHKGEILLAWWATYGFEPGNAEVVTVYEKNGTRVFVRKSEDVGEHPTTSPNSSSEAE